MADTQTSPQQQRQPTQQEKLAQREEQLRERIDLPAVRGMKATSLAGGAAFIPASVGEMLEMAKLMATSAVGVRQHLRGNPGACLAVCMQAARWGMDPFSVANKSYSVNDQIAYESQLITAVINLRAPIVGRLKTRFEGEGATRRCIAWATFEGEDEPTEVESPPFGSIKPKNSPLWTSDPDQQLAYYTKRTWARRECPEVILGAYDEEELRGMMDITPPSDAPARPQRATFTKADRPAPGLVIEGQAQDASSAAAAEEETSSAAGGEAAADDQQQPEDPAGGEALDKWEDWLKLREADVAAIGSLSDLAELEQAHKKILVAQSEGGDPVPEDIARRLKSACIERMRELSGQGSSGRMRR